MAVLKIIISWAFYIVDKIQDKYIIPLTGSIFIIGIRLKGAKLGKLNYMENRFLKCIK